MRARTLTMAVALASTGCVSTLPSALDTPDNAMPQAAAPDEAVASDLAERVDRMRGCWIARNGSGATFLRLLPPAVGAPTIEGGIDRAGASAVERVATLSFARDGSTASLATNQRDAEAFVSAAPDWAPGASTWLTYRTTTDPALFMLIEAPGETLRIMTTLGPSPGQPMSVSPLYEANRDGCD